MTRLRNVLRFVFAIGVHGAASPFVGAELIAGVALVVSLLNPTPQPPAPEDVVWVCRRTAEHCQALAADARRDAIEALEMTP